MSKHFAANLNPCFTLNTHIFKTNSVSDVIMTDEMKRPCTVKYPLSQGFHP